MTVSAPGKFVQAGQKANFLNRRALFLWSPGRECRSEILYLSLTLLRLGFGEEVDDGTGDESDGEDEYSQFYSGGGDDMVQESEGTLDARGHLNVEFPVPQTEETDTSDYSYRLEAQVTDSARRTINGTASFVATRGTIVANANADRYVYNKGDVAKIKVTTSDYEGRPVSTKCSCKLSNAPGPRRISRLTPMSIITLNMKCTNARSPMPMCKPIRRARPATTTPPPKTATFRSRQ